MRNGIRYKNCLIYGESFQREKTGTWVAQYFLTRESVAGGFPAQQYQLNDVFPTEEEADDFAVRKAREWIDKN